MDSHSDYFDTLTENGFVSFINEPTRIHSDSRLATSCLDHIWCNFECNNVSDVIEFIITDHLPILFGFRFSNSTLTKSEFRNFSINNINKFLEDKPIIFNSIVIDENNVHSSINNVNRELIKMTDHYFPLCIKYISPKSLSMPWLNTRTMNLITKKHKLFILFKRRVIPYIIFDAFSKILNYLIVILKKKYYRGLSSKYGKNSKRTWDILNQILGRNKSNPIKEIIDQDDNSFSDPRDMAESFNGYFNSIPRTLQSTLPAATGSYSSLIPINNSSIFMRRTDPIETANILTNIKKKVSYQDPPIKLINLIIPELSVILAKIFNLCLIQGTYILIH